MAVVVTGDKSLIAKLEAYRRLDIFARGFDDTGKTVTATAKALAPVGPSGRLRNSIRPKQRANQSQLKTVVQAGARLGGYAPIVHYGQYQNRQAQPFLTRALAVANSSYIEIRLDKSMGDQMRAVGL